MLIGKRQQVNNLRGIWPKETDFSDWLVTDDGLQLIAEDIGIDIEEPQRECRPGDFPCDVVGHLAGDEHHVVIIENQFNKTDHDHLGKLLTYASVNGAATAIWISEEVSDDHRKVIDWLNDNTPPQLSFYLAQIKAYRIGDSPVAPQLDVVCRPNLEVKVQRESSSAEDKARHVWRKAFWQEILPFIKSKNPPFNLRKPSTDHWSTVSLGRNGFNFSLLLLPNRQCVGCELVIETVWKASAFAQLEAQRERVENELGCKLQWRALPDKKSARVRLEAAIDPALETNRQAVKEWMHQYALAFYQIFQPRVAQLQAPPITFAEERDEADEELEAESP